MKCNNCNYEAPADFAFCPQCGAAAPAASEQPQQQQQFQQQPQQFQQQPAYTAAPQPTMFYANGTERILGFFQDTLFLVVAICFSVAAGAGLCKLSIPVIEILFTIFFWLIFVAAKKNNVTGAQVRWLSGTTFAKVILQYVAAGAILILGFVAMAGFSALGSAVGSYGKAYGYGSAASSAVGSAGTIILVVCIVAAAITVVLAIFGIRPINKFIRSAYESLNAQNLMLDKVGAAKIWLMIFGILKGISALGSIVGGAVVSGVLGSAMNTIMARIPAAARSFITIPTVGFDFFGFLGNAAMAAAYIILSIMIGKFFGDLAQAQPQQQNFQQF